MDLSSLTTLQETVHLVSMFSYINTLSDFLLSESLINKNEMLQLLPIANGIYRFLEAEQSNYVRMERSLNDDRSEIQRRKSLLIKAVINGSDIYGGKVNEEPDPIFVNELFKRIITSIVFNNDTNIYGFIVRTIRESNSLNVGKIVETMRNRLDSTLTPIVSERVFRDYIEPLFPVYGEISLTSVEFIYAQAGAIFINSGSSHPEFGEIFDSVEEKSEGGEEKSKEDEKKSKGGEENSKGDEEKSKRERFEEYLRLGHVIEYLLGEGKLDGGEKIFALPALLFYVSRERDALVYETTANIVTNEVHLMRAQEHLFGHLKRIIDATKIAKDNDPKYQFLLAMTQHKNRTSIARDLILGRCFNNSRSNDIEEPNHAEELKHTEEANQESHHIKMTMQAKQINLEDEVINYKNNPTGYRCNGILLPDVNDLFSRQNADIVQKYGHYVRVSMEIFNNLPKENLKISKGFFKLYYFLNAGSDMDAWENQELKTSDDLLKFNYPQIGDVYYALRLIDGNLTLIKEANDSKFRENLGLPKDTQFLDNNFHLLKNPDQNFTVFIDKMVADREKRMKKILDTEYDMTRKEWWIDFGLNLIPFRACLQSVKKDDLDGAATFCSLDGMILLGTLSEIGVTIEKFLTSTTTALLEKEEIKLSTLILREMFNSEKLLNRMQIKEMIKEVSTSVLKYLDPGFGLIFSLLKSGFQQIGTFVTGMERYFKFSLTRTFVSKWEHYGDYYSKVGIIYGMPTYVRTTYGKNFGYGYKFIKNDKLAEVRRVSERESEIPIFKISKDKKIYAKEYHLQNRFPFEYSSNAEIKIRVKNEYNTGVCIKSRIKRSPDYFCPRILEYLEREEMKEKAIKIAKVQKFTPMEDIKTVLSSYIYRKRYNEIDLMLSWIKDNKLPSVMNKYKIKNPEEFQKLMYWEQLENPYLSEWEANQIIASFLMDKERRMIELFKPIHIVRDEYLQYRSYESMTFLDYYSLENYMHNGFKKMSYNTNEAILMKQAINRLAIRQGNRMPKEVSDILFASDIKTLEEFDGMFQFGETNYKLTSYVQATKKISNAMEYKNVLSDGYFKVIYKFEFDKPYFSAKMENVLKNYEEEIILLPGTKFNIVHVDENIIGDELVKIVHLKYASKLTREEIMKKIMDNIYQLEYYRNNLNTINAGKIVAM